jgi:hypothetical protein
MKLQANENIILNSDDNKVVVTNLRIRMQEKEWGRFYTINIYLEDISSIQTNYKSYVILLILACLAFIGGISEVMNLRADEHSNMLAFIIGTILLLAWFFTKTRIVSFYPDGGKPLVFSANKMDEVRVQDFIEKVQVAKTERIKELYKI